MSIFASAPTQFPVGSYIDATRWNAEIYTKMTEINALFNYTTGHRHDGADKGRQIDTAGIATNAIHEAQIYTYAVTNTKIGVDAVTTTKIKDANVTMAKLTGHTKAVHDALNINADLVDSLHANKFLQHAAGTTNVKIQGGQTSVTFTDGVTIGGISFPNAFSTYCLSAVITACSAIASEGWVVNISSWTKYAISPYLRNYTGELVSGIITRDVFWIAIGY